MRILLILLRLILKVKKSSLETSHSSVVLTNEKQRRVVAILHRNFFCKIFSKGILVTSSSSTTKVCLKSHLTVNMMAN